MAEDPTLPQLQAVRLRVSKLEFSTGVPLPGAHNIYVTDAFVRVGFKWVTKEANEIEVENAQGALCAYAKGEKTFKRGEVTLGLCSSDPYLEQLLDGGAILSGGDLGDRIGHAAPALGTFPHQAVSVEVWTKRIKNGTLDTTSPYAWWVYPRIQAITPSDHEHANAELKREFVGEAYENPNWSDGPLNDWPAASDRVHQWVPTSTLPAVTGSAALLAS